MNKRKLRHFPILIILVLSLVTVGCGTKIPSGHRGVFYATFGGGTEMGKVYDEGFNWHFAWNKMIVFQTQIQERKENLTVLSSDGVTIGMEVSILFRPVAEKLDSLQINIGENYYDVKVAPTIRSVARGIAGRYKPEEIYSTKREQLTSEIETTIISEMAQDDILIEKVLIRDVSIPDEISRAINFKLTADQEAQKMKFTIEREKLEADRKRIEARGIADFQQIVSAGITESLLKWKGIEATLKVAESNNTKVVIIGSGADGLPIILGGDK